MENWPPRTCGWLSRRRTYRCSGSQAYIRFASEVIERERRCARRKWRWKAGAKEPIMAVGMHKMRLGRGLASLIGEGEGSELGEVEGQREVALDALKAGHHAWPMNALPTSDLETTLQSESTGHEEYNEDGFLILGLQGILGLLWRRKY